MAFSRIMSRRPSDAELAILLRAYTKHRAVFEADVDAARQLLQVGEKLRNPNIDIVRHAALTNVCLTILNLDEALTRE
jgi:hypothetical protein